MPFSAFAVLIVVCDVIRVGLAEGCCPRGRGLLWGQLGIAGPLISSEYLALGVPYRTHRCAFQHFTRAVGTMEVFEPKDPLEEGTATHSIILAWRIPWTEEPGGLQSGACKESDMTDRTEHARTWFVPFFLDQNVLPGEVCGPRLATRGVSAAPDAWSVGVSASLPSAESSGHVESGIALASSFRTWPLTRVRISQGPGTLYFSGSPASSTAKGDLGITAFISSSPSVVMNKELKWDANGWWVGWSGWEWRVVTGVGVAVCFWHSSGLSPDIHLLGRLTCLEVC